ncbi:MAG TPA: biotin/lipoyl-containing protein [Thermoanaerobaculia bacterium]|jgi:biotin carboxyl carrier protein
MSVSRLRRGEEVREIRIEPDAAYVDGRRVAFERVERDGALAAIRIDGREHAVVTAAEGSRLFVWCDGVASAFERVAPGRAAAAGAKEAGGDLISPMPGRVRRVLVEDGARVARGDVLLVLEAMKMEHAIRSPSDGAVRLRVAEGDLVEAGVELAQVE